MRGVPTKASRTLRSQSGSILAIPVFFRYAYLSLAYFQKRDFGQAREWAERAVARKADYWLAHALLAAARSAQGDTDGARETAKEFLQLIPDFSTSRMPIAALSSDPAHAEFRTMLTSAVSAWR